MAKINLLPWRDEYRSEKQKEFLTVIATVCAISVFAVYVWISTINGEIAHQNQRNGMLQKEIRELDEQVAEIQKLKQRRAELLARMKVIQGLQGERPVIVRYFDELVRAVPEGIYLQSLDRKGNVIEVMGVSESNVRVSAFMRNLDESDWFDAPNLKAVKAAPKYGRQASEFTMSFVASKPAEAAPVAGGNQSPKRG